MTEYRNIKGSYNDQTQVVRRETEKTAQLTNQYEILNVKISDFYSQIAEANRQIAGVQKDTEKRLAIAQEESTRKEILDRAPYDPTLIQAKNSIVSEQTALDQLLSETNGLRKLVTDQQTELEAEKRKLEKIEAELKEKEIDREGQEGAHDVAESRLAKAKQALTELHPVEALFQSLPQSVLRTVSDAEGKFKLEWPSNGRFAVFAHAQRTVDVTENYLWLVWTDGKGDLLLNNANMFGTGSADQVTASAIE